MEKSRNSLQKVETEISEKVEEVRQFIRSSLFFNMNESGKEALNEYLKEESAKFKASGTFNDTSGTAKITGSGSFEKDDSTEKLKYKGLIDLQLEAINITAKGFQRDDYAYAVKLEDGSVKIPKVDESGNTVLEFPYDELNFGISSGGVLSQIEHQLNLDEELTAGNVLGESWMGTCLNMFAP